MDLDKWKVLLLKLPRKQPLVLPQSMGPRNPREKEDLESPRLAKMGNLLLPRKMAPNQSQKGRDLPRRTRMPPQMMTRSPNKTVKRNPSKRVRRSLSKRVRRRQTRLNIERKVRSLHPHNLRRLLQVMISPLTKKRRDLKPLRTLSRNIDLRVQLLRERTMAQSQPNLKILRRIPRRKKRKRNLQRTLCTRTQWNLLKRRSSSPSGRSTDTVTGERALARLSLLSRRPFPSNQRHFSSLQKKKHSIPNNKKLKLKSRKSIQALTKKRLNSKKSWVRNRPK